jgi:hypothetical protein
MARYLIACAVIISIVACQPRAMTRAAHKAPLDSALYFEQRDISDSFFDTIEITGDNPVMLSLDRIPPTPPVPPLPDYNEVDGFRVQAFAGVDSFSTVKTAESIRKVVSDTVYVLAEKGLFKIQVGDYLYRSEAENIRGKLQQNRYSGAWVVSRLIRVPLQKDSLSSGYKIQIAATETEESAKNMIDKASQITDFRLFKEAQARKELDKIRQAGFPDAWLVY